jgi:chemotaxis signal transduction protein
MASLTTPQGTPFTTDPASMRFRDRVRARVGVADLLVFRVGEERFAIELRSVDEAVESPALRAIPEATAALVGVFSHRELLLPLYSSAAILGVEAGIGATALVMRSGTRRVGLAVDEVEDVLHVDLTELRNAPDDDRADDVLLALMLREGVLIAVVDARALLSACLSVPVPTDL